MDIKTLIEILVPVYMALLIAAIYDDSWHI